MITHVADNNNVNNTKHFKALFMCLAMTQFKKICQHFVILKMIIR